MAAAAPLIASRSGSSLAPDSLCAVATKTSTEHSGAPDSGCNAPHSPRLLCVDAHGAWTFHEAMPILRGSGERDFILEEPCARYETNPSVRLHTNLPMKLDESIDDLRSLLKAQEDQTADIVGIKLPNFGGLTGARLVPDSASGLAW
ncbi:hypothetical protein DRV85_14330 [Rhodosalinus halophilus]|uniref:Enolase C-terminal domain-containing protein n=1 Tax=Rhodosalinus halophilus TaxID=2259333 RepID=A0A365U663_9RHOB|nr:hypothetical protein DRV85_14330 [Rhodosalinus halophilus]